MSGDDDDGESWQGCLDWLFRCGCLNHDCQIYDVQQLAAALRDGVLLCHLINRLKPGTIDSRDFSNRPQSSRFLYLKNIRAFTLACKKTFGLKDADLFNPSDLVDGQDFSKVLQTLSVLSNSKEAKKSGKEGFSVRHEEIYSINPVYDDDAGDKIYNNLDDSSDNEYEDVYGTLVENAAAMQSVGSTHSAPKRELIIKELVDTEKKYVEVLELIVEKFKKPLKGEIGDKELKSIFINVEVLYDNHRVFLGSLQKSVGSKVTTVADCFLQRQEDFTAYGKFCSHLTHSQDTLTRLCIEKPDFKTRVQALNDAANKRRFRLDELLTVPFQRILKYHLLLSELVKNTDESHAERKKLENALETMKDISLYVNEMKRDSESVALILEIEKSIMGISNYLPPETHLKDYGKRLYDGEMKVKCKLNSSFAARYLFLFEKVLIICKSKGDKYVYKDNIIIAHYDVNYNSSGNDKGLNTFELRERQFRGVSTKVYVFGTKTPELFQKWQEAIDMAYDNIQPEGAITADHQFRLTTFNETPLTKCAVCQKLLKGTIFQGYRCLKTSMCVHKECILKVTYPSSSRPPNSTQPPSGVRPKVVKEFKPSKDNTSSQLPTAAGNVITPPASTVDSTVPDRRRRVLSKLPRQDNLDSYPWFAGALNRKEAAAALQKAQVGTYLVRLKTDEASSEETFALSIKGADQLVKHVIISRSVDNSYYLIAEMNFPTLVQLIEYYQQHSLGDYFGSIQTALVTPYQREDNAEPPQRARQPVILGYCRALYDFSARNPRELSFHTDDCIAVTKNTGIWWTGQLNNRTGIFPSNYVNVIPE